ncbi:DExH-box ATP-dependent RNA helicase DExH8-like [Syzygium oleosum]|uniref:DExH-box ATP-dependent RNA helicase DExH8-like n=1 Tax=Syzygium oleosum TaxID=219896 RepID=UPI0024B9E55C|nr:DExH-box ATP-dependent RNA helicase DExH8-like [Syzygium oleosum]
MGREGKNEGSAQRETGWSAGDSGGDLTLFSCIEMEGNHVGVIVCYGGEFVIGANDWEYCGGNEGTYGLHILDDTTFHFTSNIARSYDPFRMVATTRLLESSISDPSLTHVKIMWGLHHPYQTIIGKSAESQVLWKSVKCVLWFPDFEVCGHKKNFEGQISFMKNFFEYLAIRLLADTLCEVPVVLTMNNLRFSKLQVEKLGRSSFFFLTQSFPFAEQSFGELSDVIPTKKLMEVSKPILYVFSMYPPPTDVKSDDFQAAIRKCLHDVQ